MPPFNPFYIERQSATRYIPRSPSESRGTDPPSNGMFFFDEQHRKWRENEARIQQEAERGRGGNPLQTLSGQLRVYPNGGAHPPNGSLSTQLSDSIPWPSGQNSNPTPHHKQRIALRRLSSPTPSPRRQKSARSNPMPTVSTNHDLYGPLRPSQSYPYPISGNTQTMGNPNMQTLLTTSGVASESPKYRRSAAS